MLNFRIKRSISAVLVRIALVARLLLAEEAALVFVSATAFTIALLDLMLASFSSSEELPAPREAPAIDPSIDPCFVACLRISASDSPLSSPPNIAP